MKKSTSARVPETASAPRIDFSADPLAVARRLAQACASPGAWADARAHRELFATRLRWSRLAAAALRSSRLIAAGSAAGIASPVLELFTTRTRATARQIERLVRES